MAVYSLIISTASCQIIRQRDDVALEIECDAVKWSVTVPALCDEKAYSDIEWYFEQYADREPFATSRATQVVETLEIYARRLVAALNLQNCPDSIRENTLEIELYLHQDKAPGVSSILWECLENTSLWPDKIRPSSVTFIRVVAPTDEAIDIPTAEPFRDLNVLILAARPQFEDDISYRLVSKIIVEAAARSGRRVTVDIVRPGTLKAFEEHLAKQSPGYFDIVHFDVHGFEHDQRVHLGFLKSTPQNFAADPVDVSIIAELLLKHRVAHVVLNACRSGYNSHLDASIAATLVSCGISAVIAMAYQVSSHTVRQFTRAFYQQIFSEEETTFADAARLGRQAIRDKCEQDTRYGMSVRVHDDIVPVLYKNNGHEARKFWAEPADQAKDATVLSGLEKLEDKIVGRENDILLLEYNLLMESNIGVLSGRAGNGKTSLMEFLALWWRMTNFITSTLWFDAETIGKQEVLAHLREAFHGYFGTSMEVALDTLFRERYLIIFDSWETLTCPEGPSLSKQRKDLRGFLTALHGGQSLVLIISRRSEGWLSKLGPYTNHRSRWEETFSQVLEGLTPIYGVQLVGSILTNLRKSESIVTDEDQSYVEHLVKLAEGNPLVLQILSYDFSKNMISIVEYYNELLDGAQIQFEDDWLESAEGARSAVQLLNISHDQLIPNEALAGHWVGIGSPIAGGEILSLHDYFRAISLPFYALTWTAILTEDFWWLAFFFHLEVGKANHDAGLWDLPNRDWADDAIETCLFAPAALPEMVQILKESNPMFDAMEVMFDHLNQLLLAHGFLEPFSSDLINMPKKPYQRVHPLLPLVARNTLNYVECRKHLQTAFVYFQTFETHRWPHEYFYWNPIWDEPNLEMGLTFLNFHSALRNALRLRPGSTILETVILRLMTCLPKGLFADASRYGLLIETWRHAIPRTLEALNIMPNASISDINIALSKAIGPTGSPDMERLILVQQYGLVLGQASQGLMIARKAGMIRPEVPMESQFLRTAKAVIETILCHERLHERRLDSIDNSLMLALVFNLKFLNYMLGHIGHDDMWASRQEFFQYQIDLFGVEEMPIDQKTRNDVPHAVNSMSVLFSPLINVNTAVKTLLGEDRYTSARSVLQRALDSEINTAGNLAGNRTKLYQLLARVDKREGNWKDAIENLKKAYDMSYHLMKHQAPYGGSKWKENGPNSTSWQATSIP